MFTGKFFQSKQRRMKESPYYIGHNTTTKRAEIAQYAQEDVTEIYDGFGNGNQNGGYYQDYEQEETVSELVTTNNNLLSKLHALVDMSPRLEKQFSKRFNEPGRSRTPEPPNEQGLRSRTPEPPNEQGLRSQTPEPPNEQGLRSQTPEPPNEQGLRSRTPEPPGEEARLWTPEPLKEQARLRTPELSKEQARLGTPELPKEHASEGVRFSTRSRTPILQRSLEASDVPESENPSTGSVPYAKNSSSKSTTHADTTGRSTSSESLESMFKPRYNFNRLVMSCAMSKERNNMIVSGVAAAFYNGGWLPIAGKAMSNNVVELNKFIAETRADIEAGLPGRSLTVVIGSQFSDLDSVVSTITYAYLLHIKRKSEEQCFVPVINLKRSDLPVHTEVSWLFKTIGLDAESLIFADEISLSYYHRFGILKLILVDHSELGHLHENLKDTIVEVLDHEMSDAVNNKAEKVGSCCTLVAEKFALEAPDLLSGRGLSRLLLAGILLDTSNLNLSIGQCSARDFAMATLLLNGAGRYGRNGFFKMLRKRVSDLSVLSPREILNKEVRMWISKTGSTGKQVRIGLSSIGISLSRFLTVETGVADEFRYLRKTKKLDILLVVTANYDKADKFKRELLIATESEDLVHSLVEFYNSEGVQLQPFNIIGMGAGTRAFAQGNITVSHVKIHQLTEEFIKQC